MLYTPSVHVYKTHSTGVLNHRCVEQHHTIRLIHGPRPPQRGVRLLGGGKKNARPILYIPEELRGSLASIAHDLGRWLWCDRLLLACAVYILDCCVHK